MPDPAITFPLDLRPMEAEVATELPVGPEWQYEPKYDGFRCLAHRSSETAHLMSKNQKPLGRYFPELVQTVLQNLPPGTVVDGEIVSPAGFEALQLRLHPAASRVAKLAAEAPCQMIVFDLLALHGQSILKAPFSERRVRLEAEKMMFSATSGLRLGKATRVLRTARGWLGQKGAEGLVVKSLYQPYAPGKRTMLKHKIWTTYDCVVGGLSWKGGEPEHLLLGLYDGEGLLHYVGRARLGEHAKETGELLMPFLGGTGFTGKSPASENRWGGPRTETKPVKPQFVAEVSADHVTGGYMRHGARLVRWRPDKDPKSCTFDQFA